MRRRLEWFGHVKRKEETENIGAAAEMTTEGKRPRGAPRKRQKDTVRRDMKAWKIREEWGTDREKLKGISRTTTPHRKTAVKCEKVYNNSTSFYLAHNRQFILTCSKLQSPIFRYSARGLNEASGVFRPVLSPREETEEVFPSPRRGAISSWDNTHSRLLWR